MGIWQIFFKRKKMANKVESKIKWIAKLNINPNLVTLLAIPLALCATYFIIQQDFILGFIFVALAILMDFIDGSIARTSNKVSDFGNYLDAVTDKIVEGLIYLGFVFINPFFAFLAFFFSMIEAYAKPRLAIVMKIDNSDWPAIGDRADRLAILLIGFLAFIVFSNFRLNGFSIIEITLALIAILTLIGSIQRIAFARTLIKQNKKRK